LLLLLLLLPLLWLLPFPLLLLLLPGWCGWCWWEASSHQWPITFSASTSRLPSTVTSSSRA
jgi:hypothetical protein